MGHVILRLPQVKAKTGLSRTTIYSLIAEQKFPQSVSLGAKAVGWVEAEIDAWISGRIAACRTPGQPGSGFVCGYGAPAQQPHAK